MRSKADGARSLPLLYFAQSAMPAAVYNSARTKVQLRLAVQRLRVLEEKKASLAKMARREIATLLEGGREETARYKVEGMFHEDVYLELLELMELYCELLIARFSMLDMCAGNREPDPAVAEGVAAIVHAAPRTELKELHVLREMLMHKFGRDYAIAVMENRNGIVPARVHSKLAVGTPAPVLVNAYLHEIAKGYSVPWSPPASGDDDDAPSGGLKEPAEQEPQREEPLLSEPIAKKVAADFKDDDGPKLPDIPPTEGDKTPGRTTPAPSGVAKKRTSDDDLKDLAERFAQLKKPR
ncbi:regulator of Vps4 activity in the MVB pathway-domain-containing protein [Auriculariales sp. MPI-PUGE-AT-0066]|nr:regulator of Vps4 activity in the MVB pathway-domain-containing protein [Auriculariales sp. MPI-PUGE-AT-0066]